MNRFQKSGESTQNPLQAKLLVSNMGYNLIGLILPLIMAVFAFPILIHKLGQDRFGILSLVWIVLGYFGLFDLGLGRAVTKLVGERIGANDRAGIPSIVGAGILSMLAIGLFSMALVYVLSPLLVHHILKIPPELQTETLTAFRWLALAVPLVTISTGFNGVFEAHQKFGILNIIRSFSGLLVFGIPLIVVHFNNNLVYVVQSLMIVRVIILLLYILFGTGKKPILRLSFEFTKGQLRRMFTLGGWMSVSNIIGPIMVYFDRFFIGIWLSIAAVSYYVSPYEVVTKILLITGAVVRVLFPAFSATIYADPERASLLYSRGMRALSFLLFPATLILITLAEPGLRLWIGDDFARQGAPVAQWLALGCLLNSFAQVAFALVQAGGRPDLTAKLHIFEVPFYLVGLWFFINVWGITGAAFVWTLRILSDTFILFHWAKKILKVKILFPMTMPIVLMTIICVGIILINHFLAQIIISASISLLFIPLFWKYLIDAEERSLLSLTIGKYLGHLGEKKFRRLEGRSTDEA